MYPDEVGAACFCTTKASGAPGRLSVSQLAVIDAGVAAARPVKRRPR